MIVRLFVPLINIRSKKTSKNYAFCTIFTRLHTISVKSAFTQWLIDVYVKDSHRLNMEQWQTIQ